jgi:hypothetical protein
VDEVIRIKEQIEILGCFRQEETLHTVLQGMCPHILENKARYEFPFFKYTYMAKILLTNIVKSINYY